MLFLNTIDKVPKKGGLLFWDTENQYNRLISILSVIHEKNAWCIFKDLPDFMFFLLVKQRFLKFQGHGTISCSLNNDEVLR